MGTLTLIVRPDGSMYATPPFSDRILVDRDMWQWEFKSSHVLEFEAQNGEPVTYEYVAGEDPLVFRRMVQQ